MRTALWPDSVEEMLEAEMADALADQQRQSVFVAVRPSGTLGGFIEISIHPHAVGCNTRSVGYLEGWYVDPDLRQTGVGRQLIAAAESWARARGCREMASDCYLDNDVSLTAHQACGYTVTRRLIHFMKKL
ncbi:MAG: GNAT family N-acetyltransferase [Phycisphaerae bacterium]